MRESGPDDVLREYRVELDRLRAENERLRVELKIKSEFLSSRQCPDHNGKWPRGTCLQCENERLRARVAELEKAGRYALNQYNYPEKFPPQANHWAAVLYNAINASAALEGK